MGSSNRTPLSARAGAGSRPAAFLAAAEVDDRTNVGEVVGVGDAGARTPRFVRTWRRRRWRRFGVLGEELEQVIPNSISRPGLPVRIVSRMCANGRTPPRASRNVAQDACPPGRRCAGVRPGREAEVRGASSSNTPRAARTRKHAVERRLVGAGGPGQFCGASRAVGQEVGDPQLGRRVDAARDVDSPDHSQQRGRGRAPTRPGRGRRVALASLGRGRGMWSCPIGRSVGSAVFGAQPVAARRFR